MPNVFKQVQMEVSKFKTKFIAPEVLAAQSPKFKEEYEKAVEEYRMTSAYKDLVKKNAKRAVNQLVWEALSDEAFRGKIRKAVYEQVLKEI